MRPRHYTAENSLPPAKQETIRARFNEAAALHRGKLRPLDSKVRHGPLLQ